MEGHVSTAGNNRYRIAHLSDLHFGSTFEPELWEYVRGLLSEHKPNLIAITGDLGDSPSLFYLALVQQELRAMCDALTCDWVVVPGNHDMAIWGNVAIWPWTGMYRIVFHEPHARHFEKLCTFSEFRALSWWKRHGYHAWWLAKIALLRVTRQLRDPGKKAARIMNATAAKGHAVLACLDSNDRPWLATGRVAVRAIQSIDRELEALSRNGQPGWLEPRIALVHHHALPIPHSDSTESLTNFDPFLTMRNAGTLLHELGKLEFDLLLHGHKHYWNFARISFDAPGRAASEMAVIAAGSPTTKQPDAGRNSLNLIDIMPNGMVIHRPLFFGKGKTTATGYSAVPDQGRALLTMEQVKERAHRKAVGRLLCECEEIMREFAIGDDGASEFILRVKGYRVLGTRRSRQMNFHILLTSGALRPSGVHLEGGASCNRYRLMLDMNAPPTRALTVPVDLGSDVYEGREDSVDCAIRCRTVNNFAITAWEAKVLYSPGSDGNYDWAAATVSQPARKLRLTVKLPPSFEDPQPCVICLRPKDFPALRFNPEGEVLPPERESDWVIDPDFSGLEGKRLRVTDAIDGKLLELVVDQPMIGYRYLIQWQVNTRITPVTAGDRGRTMQFRERLLRMLDPDCPSDLTQSRSYGEQFLEAAFEEAWRPVFQSAYMRDEGLVAAVFVYDETAKGLRLVFETGPGRNLPGHCNLIPLNEGVAGTAFKKRSLSLFVLPEIKGQDHDGAYVYYDTLQPPSAGQDFAALVAIPLFLDAKLGTSPETVVGILSVGTNARDSGLLKLDQAPGEEATADAADVLFTVAQGFIDSLAANIEKQGLENSMSTSDNG